ncbi:galactofuranosylgalactofuranosylrhamnosyl-N-acetylglucosaminyl-diphospho-decaprenol beta-1,5/1,6-galactofuranosyltransferase [Mycolicibacterium sp. BK556]|uniref:glycosyltransferase n=1 Tax=Mycobacteriaceae TaxID=1762 RepID=UPI00105C1338|nr:MULTISPECIES: glycosyltransferase [Mycobacteriaceae]MBB3601287.1 galactofuranosylgalactofuranosylrhamnosyl-N-acetylglucosaminyl-diphospho-decaprenol beta-1,5/1,6-galactofuranosyltransferase [Mycolicibacterium sp. BK556]MBB3631039.1 galactofuranosylgalactofuranosylrhamnosyl-N-acetylglucosaminyl-diphospho-decaprenol beta-1,5/1,6-galactofuranosyltransferase [Mycolicibacterium sp. BK607]MBB3749040.1 galactofuranosylgalactofuranosylrhamnosyl-N-acetylglucosaminyl-diphospho-decaprenol beta-1,5/1,6-g
MSEIPSGPIAAGETKAVSLLARVILPRPGEPLDVRKLYIEESDTNARRAHAPTRTTLEIGAESEVSFATYFNAFPASYWRRWSTLESVVLRVELTGSARVDVYRSKATGARITVGGTEVTSPDADTPTSAEFEIDLAPFEDGGWIWFDITTDSRTTVHSAGWYAPVPAPGRASVAVGIPTFNRPADCVNALTALTSDPLVDNVITAVIVSDQGTQKAKDHPGFDAAATALGTRLTIHNQPNLGGSGGYSRVMYEALKNTDCEQILFMDDDIRVEPDSVLRALALNRFAKTPTLVGGQMLNLQEPSHLHVMGEMVAAENFMWTNAINTEYDHNFAKYPLNDEESERSRMLHRRIDVDYNGWWMCMIPRQVAEELGQPLPLFIKWDDADYGLRAGEHGYPTVTLPGAAIWHMAWSDKDDAIDWQAYFHLRNRLVVAAMHWDGNVRGLIASHMKATLKHLLCLEYSTVAIQNKAMDDFLEGPDHIFSILESALPEIRQMRSEYPDAVVLPSATTLPTPSDKRWRKKVSIPTNPVSISLRLARGVAHQLKAHHPVHHERPQINVATQDARWFSLCRVDGVTVTTADGRGVVYRQRDRAKMFALLRASTRRQLRLARQFNRMRKVYRQSLPALTSKEKWETVLLENSTTDA